MNLLTVQNSLCFIVTLVVSAAFGLGEAVGAEVPYDLEKFRPVLDDSKLQAPTSSPALIRQGDFAGASNQYFFLDETGQYMTFTVTGDGNRSELRQESGEWDTSTGTPRRISARVEVFEPEDTGLEQFTFLQIHDTTNDPGSLNKPLIRITRRGDYRSTQDHLWAHIRTPADFSQPISLDNLATLNIDLGPRPEGFFDADIQVQDSQLKVWINGENKVDVDVSYWDGLNNYFKAGVYNQDPGTSIVQFDTLQYLTTPFLLDGDYNGDGFVSQADLDLVLLNWGDSTLPSGWMAVDQFDGVQVSQNELDGVLLNWGDGNPPVVSVVPEPASIALLVGAGGALGARRTRRSLPAASA